MIESIIPLVIVVLVTAFIYHEMFYKKGYQLKIVESNSAEEMVIIDHYHYYCDKKENKYYKLNMLDVKLDCEITEEQYLKETKQA